MGLLSQALKNFFPLNNGDNDFTSSCKIPYFNASNNPYGCVSPSKLASVLGALPVKQHTAGASVNDLTEQGLYYINKGAKNITDLPTGNYIGHLVVLVCKTWWNSDLVKTQIFVTEGGIFFRFANNDKTLAQISWQQVTSTVVS